MKVMYNGSRIRRISLLSDDLPEE